MYIVYWYNEGVHSLAGSYKDVIYMAKILESTKTEFKISNGSSYVDQDSCGYGGYTYWLSPKSSFGARAKVYGTP
jgi:hypothetical protein